MSSPELHAVAAQLARWQAINTAVYWHTRPSLDVNGPHFLKDTRVLDSLVAGQLADGASLIHWALSFASVEGLLEQQSLITSLHKFKIPVTSTCVQLETHMHRLLETWKLVQGNTVDSPYGYYQRLLAALPTDEGRHLTTVRSWLAGQVKTLRAASCASSTAGT